MNSTEKERQHPPGPTPRRREDKATAGKLLRIPDAVKLAAIEAALTPADRAAGISARFALRVLDATERTILAGWHRLESREAHLLRDLADALDLDDPRARWDAALAAGELELDAAGTPTTKRPRAKGRDRVGRALRVLDRAGLLAYRPHRSRRSTPDAWARIAYGPLALELAGLEPAVETLEPARILSGWRTETVPQVADRNGRPVPRSSTEERTLSDASSESGPVTPQAREESRKAPKPRTSPTTERLRDAIRESLPLEHRRKLSSSTPRLDRELAGLEERAREAGLEPAVALAALELGGDRPGIGREKAHYLDGIRDLESWAASEVARLSTPVLRELAEVTLEREARAFEVASTLADSYAALGLAADGTTHLERPVEVASEKLEASGWAAPPRELAARFGRPTIAELEVEELAVAPVEVTADAQASASVLELHDPSGEAPPIQLALPRTIAELEVELRRSARAGSRSEVRRRFLELSATLADPPELAEAWAELALAFEVRELSAEEAREAGLERTVAA